MEEKEEAKGPQTLAYGIAKDMQAHNYEPATVFYSPLKIGARFSLKASNASRRSFVGMITS